MAEAAIDEGEHIRRSAYSHYSVALEFQRHAREQGADISFDEDGVAWLSEEIDRVQASGDEADYNRTYWHGGAFYGECQIRALGGQWWQHERSPMVRITNDNGTFPFSTVLKQLDADEGSSVVSAFSTAQIVFAEHIDPHAVALAQTRRWWGGSVGLDGEVYRHLHILDSNRAAIADEVLDAAFNVIRSGNARGVLINLARCSLEPEEVVAAYEQSPWPERVAKNDPLTRCMYTGDAAVGIEVNGMRGPGDISVLFNHPNPVPSLMGRDSFMNSAS